MPTQTIDYTKMPLGKVTRTFKGKTTGVIARCRKCDRRGERSVSIPKPGERVYHNAPYVGVTHVAKLHRMAVRELGFAGFSEQSDHCTVPITRDNVDDLLNVPERKRYDEWRAALLAYAEQF